MYRRDEPEKSDGIFVLNGQIFSVNDLINTMRRMGISIRLTRDGMTVDGEHINSITDLDGNKCPLAGNCEKRVALVDFLKLQKKRSAVDERPVVPPTAFEESLYSYPRDSYSTQQQSQHSRQDFRSEEPARDFIKPNNHDLFEGNVSGPQDLFEESRDEPSGLFDEPDFRSELEEKLFEDSFFSRSEYSDDDFSREKPQFDSRDTRDTRDSRGYFDNRDDFNQRSENQLYCKKCGYDLEQTWSTCPKCGSRVPIQQSKRTESEFLF